MPEDLVPTNLSVLSPRLYSVAFGSGRDTCPVFNILVRMNLATVWYIQNTNTDSPFRKPLTKGHLSPISNKNLTFELEITMPILLQQLILKLFYDSGASLSEFLFRHDILLMKLR